jgi:uncharacterized membrane protein
LGNLLYAVHVLGLAMGLVYLAIAFGPWRAMRSALAAGGRVRRLVELNLVLGLATVAVVTWGRFGG